MAFRKRRTNVIKMRMIAAVIVVLTLWVTASKGEGHDLILAAYYGDLSEVKRLLDTGAEVNAKTKDGQTALIYASIKGDPKVVEMLLAKGAEVNTKDNNGKTALILATRMNHPEVRELLIRAGAK